MMKVPFLCGAMLAAMAFFAGSAQAVAPDEFVRDAIRGDSSEIVLGQLAQQRASTSEVRDYAGMLVREHTQSREQFSRVAWRVHVRPDQRITSDGERQQHKLLELRGRDFDREFLRMMVDDHNTAIREYQQEVSSRNRGEPAAIAARVLPALQHHRDMAVMLQRSLEERFAYGDRGNPRNGNGGWNGNRGGNSDRGNWHPR